MGFLLVRTLCRMGNGVLIDILKTRERLSVWSIVVTIGIKDDEVARVGDFLRVLEYKSNHVIITHEQGCRLMKEENCSFYDLSRSLLRFWVLIFSNEIIKRQFYVIGLLNNSAQIYIVVVYLQSERSSFLTKRITNFADVAD